MYDVCIIRIECMKGVIRKAQGSGGRKRYSQEDLRGLIKQREIELIFRLANTSLHQVYRDITNLQKYI